MKLPWAKPVNHLISNTLGWYQEGWQCPNGCVWLAFLKVLHIEVAMSKQPPPGKRLMPLCEGFRVVVMAGNNFKRKNRISVLRSRILLNFFLAVEEAITMGI